jgi:hypothetical protein
MTHLSTIHARGGDEQHPAESPIWKNIVLNIHSRPDLTEEQRKVIVSAFTLTDPEIRRVKNSQRHRRLNKEDISAARKVRNKKMKTASHLARKVSRMAKYENHLRQIDHLNSARQTADMLFFDTQVANPTFDYNAILMANRPQDMHFALFVLFYLPVREWPSAAILGACEPGQEYPLLSQLPTARHYRALQIIFHPDRQSNETACTNAENRDQRGPIAEIVHQMRGTRLPFKGPNSHEILQGFHLTPKKELAARLNDSWALWEPAIRAFAPHDTNFVLDGTPQQIEVFAAQSCHHARIMELYQTYKRACPRVWNMIHPTAFSVAQLNHIIFKEQAEVGQGVEKVAYDRRIVKIAMHLPGNKKPGPKRRRRDGSGGQDEEDATETGSVQEGDPVSWSDYDYEPSGTDDPSERLDESERSDGSEHSEEE